MKEAQIQLLETYMSLYINHSVVVEYLDQPESPYVILDVRNAPAAVKKDQIKGAIAIPARNLEQVLDTLDKSKTYVVYDWTGGTILGKQALLILLKHGFDAYELAGALEGWKGMAESAI